MRMYRAEIPRHSMYRLCKAIRYREQRSWWDAVLDALDAMFGGQ